MHNNLQKWCGMCDAVLRSGNWVSCDSVVAAWRCPECGDGWDPVDESSRAEVR